MSTTRRIEPLDRPITASVDIPGSKSITNRALVCAALAGGTSIIRGALRSDDTEAMIAGLESLGTDIRSAFDDAEPTVVVTGVGGRFPASGVSVDARLSGTTSRFLMAAALRAAGPVVIDGHPPLRLRPMSDAIAPLRALGADVVADGSDERLPIRIEPPRAVAGSPGSVRVAVSAAASSQFLSGLMMVAPCLGSTIEFEVAGQLRSRPYVDMTLAVMREFGADATISQSDGSVLLHVAPTGYRSTTFSVEPDASAASYFWAVGAVTGSTVSVPGLTRDSLQGDVGFLDVLQAMGADVLFDDRGATVVGPSPGRLRGVQIDMADISDTVPTLAAIAPFASEPTVIDGVGFIRGKETDRIAAVVTELRRCGIVADEQPDGLTITPGVPHAATISTYDDHRIAMSFAVLGLRADGIVIDDPGCVAKTFPGFWDVFDSMRSSR